MATVTIREATRPDDFAGFGRLVVTYEGWLRDRYATTPGFVDGVLAHQDLAAELTSLPERYGPPHGATMLAEQGDLLVGAVAYHDLGDGTCEMKRMYVDDAVQGQGIGRRLCVALVDRATAAGFSAMRLDTGRLNTEAMALYESLGFRERGAYRDYPDHVVEHLRFFERPLETPPTDVS